MFERGKIVLVPFPFTDLSSSKIRPALIISEPEYAGKDVIVVFISSKIPKKIGSTDYLLKTEASFFKQTGLKVSSVIRGNKVATLDKRIILGEIGSLALDDQKKLNNIIKMALGLG